MELFKNEGEGLKKVELTEKELDNAIGGYKMVSDPIYSLTGFEEKALSQSGCYKLKKTGSGNFRITDEFGNQVNPHEIETVCKIANKNKGKGKSFWEVIFG